MIRSILSDIEGTTTSVSFVYDVLFPYARQHLPAFIENHKNDDYLVKQLDAINTEVGKVLSVEESIAQLIQWMDEDRKVTPLKTIQGMIWEEGYVTNGFQGHVYEDVPPNLEKWHTMQVPVYIYSSGSIKAQQLLFSHTIAGNLTPWLSGYFDTTTGNKRSVESYLKISKSIKTNPDEVLFLSDVSDELDAAMEAKMQTLLVIRDHSEADTPGPHACIRDFNQIQLA